MCSWSLLHPSKHPGEPLWDPGSGVAVPGWGWVPAGASGGPAADGLRRLAVLPEQQQRLLHVSTPGHRPQLWRLLRLPAAAHAGMHGILRTGYVRYYGSHGFKDLMWFSFSYLVERVKKPCSFPLKVGSSCSLFSHKVIKQMSLSAKLIIFTSGLLTVRSAAIYQRRKRSLCN